MGVKAIAFEIDHGVDDVLDDLGAGESSGFRDMAHEDHGDPGRFRQVNQIHTAVTQLRDRAWCRGDIRLVDHLNRIDDDDGGAGLVDLVEDALDVGFGQDQQIRRFDAES